MRSKRTKKPDGMLTMPMHDRLTYTQTEAVLGAVIAAISTANSTGQEYAAKRLRIAAKKFRATLDHANRKSGYEPQTEEFFAERIARARAEKRAEMEGARR